MNINFTPPSKSLTAKQRIELRMMALHLKDGVMSATDAACQAAQIIFSDSAKPIWEETAESKLWREYDQKITALTIEMLNKL